MAMIRSRTSQLRQCVCVAARPQFQVRSLSSHTSSRHPVYSAPQLSPSPSRDTANHIDANVHTANHGLFSIPQLRQPDDLRSMAETSRRQCRQLLAALMSRQSPSMATLQIMDDISDTLCRAIDVAELIRNVHPNAEWRSAAETLTSDISGTMDSLNQNTDLYRAIRAFNQTFNTPTNRQTTTASEEATPPHPFHYLQTSVTSPHPAPLPMPLDTETSRVATTFQTEMEQNGIQLPSDIRQRITQIQTDILALTTEFTRILNANHHYVNITPASALAALPAAYSQRLKPTADANTIRVPIDSDTVDCVLRWTSDVRVRRTMYMASTNSHEKNLAILDQLIELRHELARLMGFPSYADMHVSTLMARSTDTVRSFLLRLIDACKPRAAKELKMLTHAKLNDIRSNQLYLRRTRKQTAPSISSSLLASLMPTSSSSQQQEAAQSSSSTTTISSTLLSSSDHLESSFQPWDCSYYMGQLKAQQFSLNADILSSYFTIENIIKGFNLIMSRLFNVSVTRTSMSTGESWCHHDEYHLNHNEAIKLDCYDHTENEMCGRIYLDLFWRPTKIRGAAAFVVQSARHVDGQRQLPVITIVASFARPVAGHPHLLSHGSVETLFHEFGHATQHILCRNQYQHLSGARGELDFVELPSILFEHFIWDYRILKHFAQHYQAPHHTIPQQMVHNLAASKYLFFAMDTQQQAAHALFDQALFGKEYQERVLRGENDDGKSNGASGVLSTKLYGETMSRHTVLPYVEGTHPHATNGHLCHYGAGYYSYLMCRVYATALWAKWFANDPLSAESGAEYRRCVLSWGGAKNPQEILTEVLGEDHMEIAIAQFIKQSS